LNLTEDPKYVACEACGQIMNPGVGCTLASIGIAGQERARLPFGTEQGFAEGTFERPCHDCNAVAGQLHHAICDMEQCPGCGGQLISCDCEIEDYAVAQ
jgi:hypothetical protein